MHQRRFARSGNARDRDHHVQRDLDVDALQIVGARAEELDRSAGIHFAAIADAFGVQVAAQILRGERCRAVRHDLAIGAFEYDLAAEFARAGPHVDDVVGGAHHVGIVLHNHDGVAQVAQLFQECESAGRCRGECSPMEGSSRT